MVVLLGKNQLGFFKILPLARLICSPPPMSLTNEQIEEQMLQLADALALRHTSAALELGAGAVLP